MTRRALHRTGAAILGAFLVLHLGNHLLLADGFAAHVAAMERLRQVYRLPAIEAVLLAAVAAQMATGARSDEPDRNQPPRPNGRVRQCAIFV